MAYDAAPVRAEPGWYAGDFHVHGEHEPGNALMRETFDYAFAPLAEGGAGLDFVRSSTTTTPSRTARSAGFSPTTRQPDLARDGGHDLPRPHELARRHRQVDFRTAPISRREANGTLTQVRAARPAREIFDEVHAAGGFTQINHPTIFPSQIPLLSAFCRGCPWDYTAAETDYSKVDAIEVQTGPPGLDQPPRPGPNPFTPLAVRFWDEAIDSGRRELEPHRGDGLERLAPGRRPGLGDRLDPRLADRRGDDRRLRRRALRGRRSQEGVEAGHTYVKPFGQTGPDVRLEATEAGSADPPAIIGDTLESQTGFSATFNATVSNLDEARAARPGAYYVAVYRDALPVLTLPIPPSGDEFEFEFPALGYARYRLQVQREGCDRDDLEPDLRRAGQRRPRPAASRRSCRSTAAKLPAWC